jgi:phosphonopyruvate decarboxylase
MTLIAPSTLFGTLASHEIDFYTGVPDSLLKHFCAFVHDTCASEKHVIAANEGNAIALAAGYHLATGKYGAVYMQNSGLGNAMNPLVSLADPDVYCIPMMLIVGWRGEPGIKDEPQHVKQGRITPDHLRTMGLKCWIIGPEQDDHARTIHEAISVMKGTSSPVVLLVRKGSFEKYQSNIPSTPQYPLQREAALNCLLDLFEETDILVSTTGKTSRELYELRLADGKDPSKDFFTVGSMGHASSIALGITIGQPGRRVICLDGDGSMLMHLGSLVIIGQQAPSNFVHVLLNNGAHESVGGQPTAGFFVDFGAIAKACGYKHCLKCSHLESLREAWSCIQNEIGPVFLEVMISQGSRDNLGRPQNTPRENKLGFQANIRG